VRSPEQQLQQQIETWQALLEKLAGNERAIASPNPRKCDRPNSSYSSRLRRGRRCWKSWQEMNERSHLLILPSAIARTAITAAD
jgi:hypothetical protein